MKDIIYVDLVMILQTLNDIQNFLECSKKLQFVLRFKTLSFRYKVFTTTSFWSYVTYCSANIR